MYSPLKGYLIEVARNGSAINNREGELGERTISIESPQTQSRRTSFQFRLLEASSTGVARRATLEQDDNPFGRRRHTSPGSRRSSQTDMPLPYLTFQATVGRNSVQYIMFSVDNSYSSA